MLNKLLNHKHLPLIITGVILVMVAALSLIVVQHSKTRSQSKDEALAKQLSLLDINTLGLNHANPNQLIDIVNYFDTAAKSKTIDFSSSQAFQGPTDCGRIVNLITDYISPTLIALEGWQGIPLGKTYSLRVTVTDNPCDHPDKLQAIVADIDARLSAIEQKVGTTSASSVLSGSYFTLAQILGEVYSERDRTSTLDQAMRFPNGQGGTSDQGGNGNTGQGTPLPQHAATPAQCATRQQQFCTYLGQVKENAYEHAYCMVVGAAADSDCATAWANMKNCRTQLGIQSVQQCRRQFCKPRGSAFNNNGVTSAHAPLMAALTSFSLTNTIQSTLRAIQNIFHVSVPAPTIGPSISIAPPGYNPFPLPTIIPNPTGTNAPGSGFGDHPECQNPGSKCDCTSDVFACEARYQNSNISSDCQNSINTWSGSSGCLINYQRSTGYCSKGVGGRVTNGNNTTSINTGSDPNTDYSNCPRLDSQDCSVDASSFNRPSAGECAQACGAGQ